MTTPRPTRGLAIEDIEHVNGVAWHEAPLPRRLHRCKPQTTAWINIFDQFDRCACGAARYNGRGWMGRNSSRGQR